MMLVVILGIVLLAVAIDYIYTWIDNWTIWEDDNND
jgi:hypothetical protein